MLTKIQSPVATKLYPSPNYDTPSDKRSGIIVVHDVEAPMTQGYCDSLAEYYFGEQSSEVSAHYLVGPSYPVQMVAEQWRAWHCGPAGNILSIGIEQTGYASFTRAQWTTALGKAQIKVLAQLMSDISHRHGGPLNPQRASNAQLQAYAKGDTLPGHVRWVTHHQITEALGGTTHHDPDPDYPYDLLQDALDAKAKPAPTPPAKAPAVYTVQRGDTLSAIAEKFDTTVPTLVKLNKLSNPNLILIGQKIKLSGNATTKPAPKPDPKPAAKYTPPPGHWPLGPGDYFGDIKGDADSHGGFYDWERKYVRWIQTRMNELIGAGLLVDGKFGPKTIAAVAAWQRKFYAAHHLHLQFAGQVWSDDYAYLQRH